MVSHRTIAPCGEGALDRGDGFWTLSGDGKQVVGSTDLDSGRKPGLPRGAEGLATRRRHLNPRVWTSRTS